MCLLIVKKSAFKNRSIDIVKRAQDNKIRFQIYQIITLIISAIIPVKNVTNFEL
jgi:hypothetical protein